MSDCPRCKLYAHERDVARAQLDRVLEAALKPLAMRAAPPIVLEGDAAVAFQVIAERDRLRAAIRVKDEALRVAKDAIDGAVKDMRTAFHRSSPCPCANTVRFSDAWDDLMPYWGGTPQIDAALAAGGEEGK